MPAAELRRKSPVTSFPTVLIVFTVCFNGLRDLRSHDPYNFRLIRWRRTVDWCTSNPNFRNSSLVSCKIENLCEFGWFIFFSRYLTMYDATSILHRSLLCEEILCIDIDNLPKIMGVGNARSGRNGQVQGGSHKLWHDDFWLMRAASSPRGECGPAQ